MTKNEFIKELEKELFRLPEEEKKDVLDYYNDYFAEAGIEDYMQIPSSMEKPREIAKNLGGEESKSTNDYYDSSNSNADTYYSEVKQDRGTYYGSSGGYGTNTQGNVKDSSTKIIAIVLLVIFSPVILGVVTGIAGTLFGILVALIAMVIAFSIGGVSLGVMAVMSSGVGGTILFMGIGMILLSLAICSVILLTLYCGKFLPLIYKTVVGLIENILGN